MKMNGISSEKVHYYKLDEKESIKSNLKGKEIIEFPTFVVILKSRLNLYDIVTPDIENLLLQNTNSHLELLVGSSLDPLGSPDGGDLPDNKKTKKNQKNKKNNQKNKKTNQFQHKIHPSVGSDVGGVEYGQNLSSPTPDLSDIAELKDFHIDEEKQRLIFNELFEVVKPNEKENLN